MMIYSTNNSTDKKTWGQKEKAGMHKSNYCKEKHKCYTCEYFQRTYEDWTCQELPLSHDIHTSNYNIKVDDVMNIFESKCPLEKGKV